MIDNTIMTSLSRLALLALLTGSFALTACGDEEPGDGVMGHAGFDFDVPGDAEQAVHAVCGAGPTVKGIDVSKWQGTIDWARVAGDGVKFAFIRVGDGPTYVDEKFAYNWSHARSNGIKRGAYQFFRSDADPIVQADLLLRTMGHLQAGDLPPVIDVESTDGVSNATRARKVRQWLEHVEAALGVKPLIYTGGYFWDDNVAVDLSTYPLWHAGYTGGTCPSTLSRYWSHWTVWQWTSSGSVAGISGRVDMNRFNGTMTQLNELGLDPCTPSAEVCDGADNDCDGDVDEGGVCVPQNEAIYGAALFDAAGTSDADVDGDGIADVCARAALGITCAVSGGGAPLSAQFDTTSFADANGWSDVTNYATLRLADVTGDGRADFCARANAKLVCRPSTGTGFGDLIDGPAWADDAGWNKPAYYTTVRMADVDGDGKADACARAAAGFRCHLSTGAGFSDGIAGDFFTDAQGFDDPSHYGTIRMADIDGDGHADVCARTVDGLECHRLENGAWGPAIIGPAWSEDAGFDDVVYWSTLRIDDLDGDRKADACIRAADGIHCRLSTGTGFSDEDIRGPELSDDNGWNGADNYPTLRMADVDGDGGADLCARANAGMRCWTFQSDHTFAGTFDSDLFADGNGFGTADKFRTIRMADVDGDGKADACGRGTDGLVCVLSTGTDFGATVAGPAWSDANGWNKLMYAGALLASGSARCHPAAEVCDGVDNDCNGVVDDGSVCAPPPDDTSGEGEGEGDSGDAAHAGDVDGTASAADADVDAPVGVFADGGCAATPTASSSSTVVVLLGALGTFGALGGARRRRRAR